MTDVTANQNADVDEFMKALDHPLKDGIERLRLGILNSNTRITEHIKWNAPSFLIDGEDRVTFNLHAKDGVQLIFHRGTKVKDSKDFVFEDGAGLLEWRSADRAIVTLRDLDDIDAKEAALVESVNRWMEATSA
jgi:uncharacterized protein YdeI (YjbR/CyaY-like superfamily)